MAKRSALWPSLAIIIALCAVVIALPDSAKSWAPSFVRSPTFHFGLDLAGGTQLDFRISEREMEEQLNALQEELKAMEQRGADSETIASQTLQIQSLQEQKLNLVESIRTVIERRINALGVSEAIITPSYIGGEKHLLVECPGVVDTQECIETVGKTIQLEFKEEFTEADEGHEADVRAMVDATEERMTQSGLTIAQVGEDIGTELGVVYSAEQVYYRDQLSEGLEDLWSRQPGQAYVRREGVLPTPQQGADGEISVRDVPGIYLAEVVAPATDRERTILSPPLALEVLAEREGLRHTTHTDRDVSDIEPALLAALQKMQIGEASVTDTENDSRIFYLYALEQGQEEMSASHILISYAGASAADPSVVRSQEDAQKVVQELKNRLDAGEDFTDLAVQYSDGPSGKDGGNLGTFDRSTMVPSFSDVSFGLSAGEISDIVETQFGYHIIRAESDPVVSPTIASYDEVIVSGEGAHDRAVALITQVQNGEVTRTEPAITLRHIFFSLLPTGWKDTTLDGKHFRSATVTVDPTTNFPIVQIIFDDEGAVLFRELTKRNIGKRIAIFVGGQMVSAPTVQGEISGGTAVITGSQNFEEAKQLATDLNTGAIPAPIFLTGQRTVEATLGAQALETSLKAALIGLVILIGYMIVMYRMLGVLASIALGIYALLFVTVLKLPLFLVSSQNIVLTLAGMAGIILSIGMAVDANVLIFERLKEELRKGKLLSTAADTGFQRAWPSIRDGNVSTFITCAILFVIGTSIVRGFAVTLGMGVLISMFSAIVVTRWLIRQVAKTSLAEKTALFGVKQEAGESA